MHQSNLGPPTKLEQKAPASTAGQRKQQDPVSRTPGSIEWSQRPNFFAPDGPDQALEAY